MNINRLKREIQDQTRNGRKEVYIKLEDIKQLEDFLAGNYGEHRIMIEADYISELIDEFEKNRFKRSLRADTKLIKADDKEYYFEEVEREVEGR